MINGKELYKQVVRLSRFSAEVLTRDMYKECAEAIINAAPSLTNVIYIEFHIDKLNEANEVADYLAVCGFKTKVHLQASAPLNAKTQKRILK